MFAGFSTAMSPIFALLEGSAMALCDADGNLDRSVACRRSGRVCCR